MSVLDKSAAVDPQPESKTHDLRWLALAAAVLFPAGMVWGACHDFVVQMCVNNPRAWWSMAGFGIPAIGLLIAEHFASLLAFKRSFFIAQLVCLVGVGIVAGLLSWVHWG